MSIVSHPLTYADLERARETTDDRLELIAGEIVVTPSPTPFHQIVQHRLGVLLDRAIVETRLGIVMSAPLDVFLEEHTVFQPDLVVLLRDRRQLYGDSRIEGAPNLVIEIASPSTGARDRGIKRDLFARYGVLEYWFVDPDTQTITIYSHLDGGRYEHEETIRDLAVSILIPDLTVDLATLFAPVWDV